MEYGTVEKPQVINWFKFYCVLMALLYFLVFIGGVVLAVVPAENMDIPQEEAAFLYVYVVLFIGFGLALGVAFLVGLFLGPKPWVWVYDIVLICLGLTSCCTMIICIPLLIYWIKPETKAYFGR